MKIFGKLPDAQACTDEAIGFRATLPKDVHFWEALAALPNLVSLELNTYIQYGEISDVLAKAPKLRTLMFNGQAYYVDDLRPIPPVIWRLPHLETLWISNAPQTDWEGDDWSGLVSLRELQILQAGTQFPPGIFSLPQLQKLHLGGTANWQYPIQGWEKLRRLKHFISDNTTMGKIEFWDMPELEALNICVAKSMPEWLDQLQAPKLRWLRFMGMPQTTLAVPSSIYRFSGLESLEFCNLGLDSLSPEIGQLKRLRCLSVEANRLSKLPETLIETALEELTLRNNAFEHLPGLLLRLMPRLKMIDKHRLAIHSSEVSQFDRLAEKLLEVRADAALRATVATLWDDELPERLDAATLESIRSLNSIQLNQGLLRWLTEQSAQAYRPLKKGDSIAVSAKLIGKRTDIKTKLKAEGISIIFLKKEDGIPAETSHLLLDLSGALPYSSWYGEHDFCLMTEVQLNAFLNEKQPDYLRKESNENEDSEWVKNVKSLLHSLDESNIGVALGLLKSGGVPEDCKDELFVVHKLASNDAQRSEAGRLLKTVASEALLTALKKRVLFRSISFYDHVALANALSVFDYTELNMGYFARMYAWIDHGGYGRADILYYLIKAGYSEELQLFLNGAITEEGFLYVGFAYDTEGISYFPVEIFQVQGVRSLELYLYGREADMRLETILRPELLAMQGLEELRLRVFANGNVYFDTWEKLEPLVQMKQLKKLSVEMEDENLRKKLSKRMPRCKIGG